MSELHLIQFTFEEIELVIEALRDSSRMRSDSRGYARCTQLAESLETWKDRQAR